MVWCLLVSDWPLLQAKASAAFSALKYIKKYKTHSRILTKYFIIWSLNNSKNQNLNKFISKWKKTGKWVGTGLLYTRCYSYTHIRNHCIRKFILNENGLSVYITECPGTKIFYDIIAVKVFYFTIENIVDWTKF